MVSLVFQFITCNIHLYAFSENVNIQHMCLINYHRELLKQIHRYIARYPWLQVNIPVTMLNIIDDT